MVTQKTSCFCFVLLMMLFVPGIVLSQLISIKSVPVVTGDQFLIYPSQNMGMGGVSIALDDALLDPFVNPAKGSAIQGATITSSPVYYGISDENGSARTLPLGLLYGAEKWFGGLSLSIQQLDLNYQAGTRRLASDKSCNNLYASGLLGIKLPAIHSSLAASVFYADLDAVDGIEHLYANSMDIEQYGNMTDIRLGLLSELNGDRTIDVLLLYNHFDMTHEVTYNDFNDFGWFDALWAVRKEVNPDRSNTWGVHLGYVQPVGESDWKIGGILTGNWKSHPKIPNYEIMNILRDPGTSSAYNVGLGLSRSFGQATFGFDLIYEPIWSNTWAEAISDMQSQSGRPIPKGGKTIENDFWFSNAVFRIGIRKENERAGFQLGLEARSIRYQLDQYDYVQEFRRQQDENWIEWTPSWGLLVKFREFRLQYTGRMILGTGQPGVDFNTFPVFTGQSSRWSNMEYAALADANILLAPGGALNLESLYVMTHQISISIPLSGKE